MKKLRFLPIVLALSLLMPVISLSGCTDKKKPRVLDSVESSIVGTWINEFNYTFTFKDDGTCTLIQHDSVESYTSEFNFYHIGEDVETDGEARGHYYKIYTHDGSRNDAEKYDGSPLAIFDRYPNKLLWIINGVIDSTDDRNAFIRQTSNGNTNELDSVEQSIVGEWQDTKSNSNYTFYDNGTLATNGQNHGLFYHNGDGDDSLYGHYNIIQLTSDKQTQYRLYDFANGVLYAGASHIPFIIKNGCTRVLHSCERILLGSWQAVSSKSRQYIFGLDGTINCTSWQSDTLKYFYINGEGNNAKGHYYIFIFPDTGILNWRIYDDDPINAYDNISGAKVATYI